MQKTGVHRFHRQRSPRGQTSQPMQPMQPAEPARWCQRSRATITYRTDPHNPQYFGEHQGITCDGCGGPVVGYRYKCSKCQNHDVCEGCYDTFRTHGVVTNNLSEQRLSSDPKDHNFKLFKGRVQLPDELCSNMLWCPVHDIKPSPSCFRSDSTFKPLVKGAGGATKPSAKKVRPNDPCTCDSGKKYKKCCGLKK